MNHAVLRRWKSYVSAIALLTLLAGCVAAPHPHQMGDPLAGMGVKPAPAPASRLRDLAHKDIALLLSPNTRAVLDAVSVPDGANIMFNVGALPKRPGYDFAAQISAASAALFRDRFGKVVKISRLENAERHGLHTAAILDLQVFDSKPGAGAHGSFFRSRAALYFVDVKTGRQLGALAAGETLMLGPASGGNDAKTATARRNKLLSRVLAKAFWSLSRKLDVRLGTAHQPVALPVALTAAAPVTSRKLVSRGHRHHQRRMNRHLARLAKKLHRLDEMHAYGLLSNHQYKQHKRRLIHRYRHYLH